MGAEHDSGSGGWPTVGIVGGSIGGLTAALALRDLGCSVDVYERASTDLEARGAGIGLHPVTTRWFTEHSALDNQRAVLTLPWLRYLHRDGSVVHQERMNYRFSSWNTLYRRLLAAFGRHRYHLEHEVSELLLDARGVRLAFSSGGATTRRYDLVVCADGITSGCRRQLQPAARERYAGYVAWRATVPEALLTAETFEALRDGLTYCVLPGGHVLVYPIPGINGDLRPGHRLANLVWYHNYAPGAELDAIMTDASGTPRDTSVPPGAVRAEHVAWAREYAGAHMAPQIAEVMRCCEAPFIQAIYDIEVERMAFGRAVLIGDGAFAVRPHAAAGTAKACADAWALRDALQAAAGDVEGALRRWEPEQLALGRSLLTRARRMGERSQFEHTWIPGDPDLRLGLYGPGR